MSTRCWSKHMTTGIETAMFPFGRHWCVHTVECLVGWHWLLNLCILARPVGIFAIQGFGNLGIQTRNAGSKTKRKQKMEHPKWIRPAQKMSARSGLIWISRRKKIPWPHLWPFQVNFSMDRKHAKTSGFLATRVGVGCGLTVYNNGKHLKH